MYVDTDNIVHYTNNDIHAKNKKALKSYTKKYLLQSNKYDLYQKQQKDIYYRLRAEQTGNYCNKYEMYRGVYLGLTDFERKCCEQLFNARRSRVLRLKKKITKVIENNDCLFLTMTFTNGVLNTTTKETRRRYITRFLKSLHCSFAVANIDYGDREKNPLSTEREHYHAIVQLPFIDPHIYKYGRFGVEKIRRHTKSIAKLSQYINKLSYHAFKDSTGQDRLIYLKK